MATEQMPHSISQRWRLAPLASSHVASLTRAVRELAAHPSGQRFWWAKEDYAVCDAMRFVSGALRDRQACLREVWAVEEAGEVLGLVHLKQLDWVHGCAQAGYWLRPSAQGRGLGSASLRALGALARQRGLARLEFLIAPDNEASQAVARRCGAQEEGILRHRLLVQGKRCDAVLMGWCL